MSQISRQVAIRHQSRRLSTGITSQSISTQYLRRDAGPSLPITFSSALLTYFILSCGKSFYMVSRFIKLCSSMLRYIGGTVNTTRVSISLTSVILYPSSVKNLRATSAVLQSGASTITMSSHCLMVDNLSFLHPSST